MRYFPHPRFPVLRAGQDRKIPLPEGWLTAQLKSRESLRCYRPLLGSCLKKGVDGGVRFRYRAAMCG